MSTEQWIQLINFFVTILISGCFYRTYIQEAKTKYGHPFMVRLSQEMTENQDIRMLLEQYRKKIRRLFFLFVCIDILVLFCPAVWGIFWMAASIFVQGMIPSNIAGRFRKKIVGIKQEKGWKIPAETRRKIDLSLDRKNINQSMLSVWWYLFPTLLYGIVCFFSMDQKKENRIWIAICIIEAAVMFVGRWFLSGMQNQTYCKEGEINRKVNQIKKSSASRAWFVLCTGDAICMICIWAGFCKDVFVCFFLAGFCIPAALAVMAVLRKNYVQKKRYLLADETVYEYDEDDYWSFGLWGLEYENPYDPQTLKENNSGGWNQTVNKASRQGRWMILLFLLFLVGIALFVAWQFLYPAYLYRTGRLAELKLDKNQVLVESPLYEAEIPVREIREMELAQQLGNGERTNGAATDIYGKGRFRYDTYGEVYVYICWKTPPYLILKTKKEIYIVNDDDAGRTIQIYEALKKKGVGK